MNSELLVANGMSRVDDYIAHYGRSVRDGAPVGSGRYHLGSGEDPYQMFTRDREEAPKGLSGVISKLKRHGGGTATAAEKKLLKQQLKIQKAEFKTKKAEEKRAAKEEAERKKVEDLKRQIEDKKFKLLRDGNIEKILANREMFSTQELQDAIDRNNKIKMLQSELPKPSPKKSLVDKVDGLVGVVGKAAGWIETGAKFAKAVQTMKNVKNDKKTANTKTLGQQYAEKFLKTLKNKSLDEVDVDEIKKNMDKIRSVNELTDMSRGVFNQSQNNNQQQNNKKNKDKQNQNNNQNQQNNQNQNGNQQNNKQNQGNQPPKNMSFNPNDPNIPFDPTITRVMNVVSNRDTSASQNDRVPVTSRQGVLYDQYGNPMSTWDWILRNR